MTSPEIDPRATVEKISSSGVSLRELLAWEEDFRSRRPGQPPSERVYFLAEEMESENFWLQLNAHLAEDKIRRHSVGGVFRGVYGEKEVWKLIPEDQEVKLIHKKYKIKL